jgi:S1-C subfamily serine protease
VKIRVGEGTFGSGWAIEEGWVITNQHVITGFSTVTIEVPDPDGGVRSVQGTIRGFDTKRDLAAIQVDHGAPVLPARVVTALDAGESVVQLGYSVSATGGFPVIHSGVITTVVRHLGAVLDDAPKRADLGSDSGGVGVVVFDAAADPGDSGGPVLDLAGNVVAITYGTVVQTSSGKRVIGQQEGTAIESIERVWDDLKEGTNTTFVE